MKIRLSNGKGINQQFGLVLSAFLAGLIFFELNTTFLTVLPLIALMYLITGLQTAIFRGGLNVSKKGKWGLNYIRNWLFIYSSIIYGLLNLRIIDVNVIIVYMPIQETLTFTVALLFAVSVIMFISGGDK